MSVQGTNRLDQNPTGELVIGSTKLAVFLAGGEVHIID